MHSSNHSPKFMFSDTFKEPTNYWFYKNGYYYNKPHSYKIASENVFNNIWRAPFSEELEHLVHKQTSSGGKPPSSTKDHFTLGYPTLHAHPVYAPKSTDNNPTFF